MIKVFSPHGCLTHVQVNALKQLTMTWPMTENDRATWHAFLTSLIKAQDRGQLFVKILKDQWLSMVRALKSSHVKRPDLALRVLSALVVYVERETGEIVASRQDIAREVGAHPANISHALTDLVSLRAIRKVRSGPRSVYFINPNLVWNGTETSRQDAIKNFESFQTC